MISICVECKQPFEWPNKYKLRCPSCYKARHVKQHRESDAIWRHSPKGIASYQNKLAKKRQHPKSQPHFCSDCGKKLRNKASMRCKKCFIIYLRGRTGINHPNWKGGIQVNSGGYILISSPNHPRADRNGRVRQHLLIWEKSHGKPLPLNWIIHHLNGITDDNRPSNLVGLPCKKHYLLLQAKAKRIQELEAQLNHQAQLL